MLDSWRFGAFFRIVASSWPLPGLFWPLPGLFWPFPGLFRAFSWPLPGLFWPLPGLSWPLPGLFWPLPGLFWPLLGLFLDSPKSPKFKGSQRRHFLFIKHCVSSNFSPNSGFLAFWCLFRIFFTLWPFPLPGLFRASSGLFRASSGLFLASSWPLFGFFLDSPKSPKFRGPQRPHLSVHKTCVSSSFSPNSGFLAFWGLFWPFSGLFLASFGPFPGLFWPLPGLFLDFSWILQSLQNSGAPRDVIFCS